MNYNQKSLNFQNIQNFPEYNRILYSRVSEILRNFKSLENTDDQFLHIRDRKKSNIPQRKNEIFSLNSSFLQKMLFFLKIFISQVNLQFLLFLSSHRFSMIFQLNQLEKFQLYVHYGHFIKQIFIIFKKKMQFVIYGL